MQTLQRHILSTIHEGQNVLWDKTVTEVIGELIEKQCRTQMNRVPS